VNEKFSLEIIFITKVHKKIWSNMRVNRERRTREQIMKAKLKFDREKERRERNHDLKSKT
jgi:hypothetical protein